MYLEGCYMLHFHFHYNFLQVSSINRVLRNLVPSKENSRSPSPPPSSKSPNIKSPQSNSITTSNNLNSAAELTNVATGGNELVERGREIHSLNPAARSTTSEQQPNTNYEPSDKLTILHNDTSSQWRQTW